MNFKNLFANITLSDEEEAFLNEAQTATTADMNQSQVATNLYFAKTLEDVADKIINLNDKVEAANARYSMLMVLLTFAIFLTGFGTVVSTLNVRWLSYGYLGVLAIVGIWLGTLTYRKLRD